VGLEGDFEMRDQEKGWHFCTKILGDSSTVNGGVGINLWFIVEVVKAIGLFNVNILERMAKLTIIPTMPFDFTYFTHICLPK